MAPPTDIKRTWHKLKDAMPSPRHRTGEASHPVGLPDNLNANSMEMQDRSFNEKIYDTARAPNPYYTPYLGRNARLSQVWINKWTILLLLILVRVLLAIKGLYHDIDSAKVQALSACTSVENVGSAMASMPHYMSSGVNAMAAKSVEVAVEALFGMLMLSITAVQEIVLFIINLLTSTYVCLITLVVGGAMEAALVIVEKAAEVVKDAIDLGTKGIENGVSGFQDLYNGFTGKVEDAIGLLGKTIDIPTLNLDDEINNLKGFSLDTDALTADLNSLKDKIPTFDEVHNFTNTMIRTPFQMVKQLINDSAVGYKFDQTVFPVAEKQALSFCSDNNGIDDFFNGLINTASTAKKAFLGIVIALAILVCAPMAWREMKRWKKTSTMIDDVYARARRRPIDPQDIIYRGSRPYTSAWGITLSNWSGGKKINEEENYNVTPTEREIRKDALLRWFVAYITSVPALFVLLLGIAGLISCLFQYILLRQIEQETPVLAAQVGAFTGQVVTALTNASEQWAVGANSVIESTNTQINSDVFGWVNISTTGVNDTLNAFVDGTQKVLNDTFGGTILYNPIQETLRCLIFLKVEGIQKALTWVHDNAHVAFPPFDKDVFSLGAAASLDDSGDAQTFLSSPGSEAADDITGAVLKLTDFMKEGIVQEIYISLALIGVWFIIVLIALGRVIVGLLQPIKTRAMGGGAPAYPTSPLSSDRRKSPKKQEEFYGADVDETPRDKYPPQRWAGHTEEQAIGRGEVVGGKVERMPTAHKKQSSYGGLGMVDEKGNVV